MTPEARITARIVRLLKHLQKQGETVWWAKLHGHHMQSVGLPDLLVCYEGRWLLLEVKRPGAEPTARQEHEFGRIRAAGGDVKVVTSVNQAAELLGVV